MKHFLQRIWVALAVSVFLVSLLLGSLVAAHGGEDIPSYTVDGGGQISMGGDLTVEGTIGQADAGTEMQGDGYTVVGGFWGAVYSDADGDGVLDVNDNCPYGFNPDQLDGEKHPDGIGDICDPDTQDSSAVSGPDHSVAVANPPGGDTVATFNGTTTLQFSTVTIITDTTGIGTIVITPRGKYHNTCRFDIVSSNTLTGTVTVECQYPDGISQKQFDSISVGKTPGEEITPDQKSHYPDTEPYTQVSVEFQIFDDPSLGVLMPLDTDADGVFDQFDIDGDGDFDDPWELDACPGSAGFLDRQGCTIGDANEVELHIVDLAKSGACSASGHSCKLPVSDASVRVFDRNDAEFQSSYGTKNPSGTIYDQVFENGIGQIAACSTDDFGQCTTGEEGVGDYLVIVRWMDPETDRIVYSGKPKSPTDFVDTNDDGIGDLATKEFQIIKVIKKDGSIQYGGGSKRVVTGSYLEIVNPDIALWEDVAAGYVYPFIFASDSEWEVDVCVEVPQGYSIVGMYDENGTLVPEASCSQVIVLGEAKVIAFEIVETGSPEPHLKARFKLRHNNRMKVIDLDVPGLRVARQKARRGPLSTVPMNSPAVLLPADSTASYAQFFGEPNW